MNSTIYADPHPIRFRKSTMKILPRVAKAAEKTMQDYIRDAVEQAIARDTQKDVGIEN